MILQPPATLVAGAGGSGKTSAIATKLLGGLEVFVMVTEPGGVESLLDSCERIKAPVDKLHWTSCLSASAGFAGLEDMIRKINSMDQKGLSDVKDMGKADFRDAALNFLNALRDFKCERTGVAYGSFTTWDDTRSLDIDSLSGWTDIAWGATVGYKPTANPGEWGIGQNFIHNMLLKINNDRRCYFGLTAHIEREVDDMTGAKKIMVSTLGAKLAPKIPRFFSDVIKAEKRADKYFWSTSDMAMDLKNRNLPSKSDLDPDFRAVIASYERRKKLAAASPPPAVPPQPPAAAPEAPKIQVAPMSPQPAATSVQR